ncbi:MAG: cytochrome-c peroxidase [Acidobacteria bacterium]|nr:cytochrome-c peroxidase [Acidobacteriota bacterium]
MTAKYVPVLALALAGAAAGQPLRSLKGVAVPAPPGLGQYVGDHTALVALGKALFWDMQTGSDGRTACATCHFHAGADHRDRNQIADPNNPFQANITLAASGFPLRLLADPLNRNSPVLRDSSQRIGSAGVFRRVFGGLVNGQPDEAGTEALDAPQFAVQGLQVRRVTPRNSPSVINAAHSVRGFWDGRAARVFNGFTISGDASPAGALVWRYSGYAREPVRLDNSSLASQAVGPIMDHLEMSYQGRSWLALARKVLNLPPLGLQRVAADDSVLGAMARSDGRGLSEGVSYPSLIRAAFQPHLWESAQLVDAEGQALPGRHGWPAEAGEYAQMEHNFPLFWGLAIQAYESTLISDEAPVDRFFEGDETALSDLAREGLQLFQGNGRCTTCHSGPEFSAAGYSAQGPGRGGNAIRAFIATGVRPAGEDAGAGNAAFKSMTIRNVEFTGPYFHNGGQATLEQLAGFYARGGDFNNNGIRPLGLTARQQAALVEFMKAASDDRVRYERAPFDHPELCVPNGHAESASRLLIPSGSAGFPRASMENWAGIPAVGASGNAAPLQTFEELLNGTGADGSRAHHLRDACAIPFP